MLWSLMDRSVYYITNYTPLMTPKEFAAFKWLIIAEKTKNRSTEAIQPIIRHQWLERWQSIDPETIALIEMGWEQFLQHAHDRIVRDHPNEVGRCPQCGRLTATRQAQQCFGCG